MAALALPLIEGAVDALLAAFATTAVVGTGVVVADQVQKRAKAASESKDKAIAQTATTSATRKACDKCPPDCGVIFPRSTKGWSAVSIEYQQRIGGMPPSASGLINEWAFNGVNFDGFDSSQCLLKEAKARYDQFFDEFRQIKPWWGEGADTLLNEAMRQSAAARPTPPIRLRWYFMEPISYRYFSRIIISAYPSIEVVYQP